MWAMLKPVEPVRHDAQQSAKAHQYGADQPPEVCTMLLDDRIEASLDGFEVGVHRLEPAIDCFEPAVDRIEAPINRFETAVNQLKSVIYCIEPPFQPPNVSALVSVMCSSTASRASTFPG